MTLFDAVILGLVEGITEFLPISSTGHMILVSTLLRLENTDFLKTFEIAIQLGAVTAIVFIYARNLVRNVALNKKLLVAFVPAAIVGAIAYKAIKTYFFNPFVVAAALIVGGVVIILLDARVNKKSEDETRLEDISYRNAFMIGMFQCISMIPGVSRAAATIIGGVLNGLNKKQATEFSFLLAIPTMAAATGYDLVQSSSLIARDEVALLALGGIMSFVSAWMAVKLFLRFIQHHGFACFGYYRIILGVLFLLFFIK